MDTLTQRVEHRFRRILEASRDEKAGLYLGLEGPDGIGKSTLARSLSDQLGIKTFHRHPKIFGYHPQISVGMEWAALKLREQLRFNLIEERTFLGYAVYKNNPAYTPDIRDEFIRLIQGTGKHLYVFLSASNAILRNRLKEKGEYVPDVEIHAAMYEQFFNVVRPNSKAYDGLNVVEVDASKNIQSVADAVLEEFEKIL